MRADSIVKRHYQGVWGVGKQNKIINYYKILNWESRGLMSNLPRPRDLLQRENKWFEFSFVFSKILLRVKEILTYASQVNGPKNSR